ncbi:hypothetical protein ACFS6H_00700 [Terrimonas rubra]|uniref:Helix-turn-helix domain-containing protein n=1 Tax=Terrimonas rubra TaxID=1035890 RepID=A0ABW6A2J4_9BACT
MMNDGMMNGVKFMAYRETLKAQGKKLKAVSDAHGIYAISVDRLRIMEEMLKAQGKKLKAVSDAHGIIQYQLIVYGS